MKIQAFHSPQVRLSAFHKCISSSSTVDPRGFKPFILAMVIGAFLSGCGSDQRVKETHEGGAKSPVMTEASDTIAEEIATTSEDLGDVSMPAVVSATALPPSSSAKTVILAEQPRQDYSTEKREFKRARHMAQEGDSALFAAVRPIPELHQQSGVRDREQYLAQEDNPIRQVSEDPVSTFSVDVDTASYSNVRRMIMREGRLPPHDAVKAEEFINYFRYQYPQPQGESQPFSVHSELMASPWNPQKHLLKIGLQGYQPQRRPAANLVFLVDVSGSMQSENKLGLAKRSLKMLAQQMRDDDRIALVVYAGAAGVVLPSTSGSEKHKISAAIDQLTAGGSTHGSAGIQLAYDIAKQNYIKEGINRVLIASDGDMNVGTVNHEALKNLIADKRKSGVALSTLGFGSGNYNYALMEQLADVGNGNASYVDSLKEAHRVLVQQMNSTLMTIAKDVKIQIEFNPQAISEYRLIGYENRLLKREDFRNDQVDAGEIGAGHSVTALYEISLKGSGSESISPLRYARKDQVETADLSADLTRSSELGFVKLRYKRPTENDSQLISFPLTREVLMSGQAVSTDMQWASAVAGFSQLLSGAKYTADWGFGDVLELARSAKGDDLYGHRAEMINLIELSQQWQLAQH